MSKRFELWRKALYKCSSLLLLWPWMLDLQFISLLNELLGPDLENIKLFLQGHKYAMMKSTFVHRGSLTYFPLSSSTRKYLNMFQIWSYKRIFSKRKKLSDVQNVFAFIFISPCPASFRKQCEMFHLHLSGQRFLEQNPPFVWL